MSLSTLEGGKFPKVRQWNYSRILEAGLSLVTRSVFGSDKVTVAGLVTSKGDEIQAMGLFADIAAANGSLILDNLEKDENKLRHKSNVCQFTYYQSILTKSDDIFLSATIDTNKREYYGLGIASGLAFLGIRLLQSLAPIIAMEYRAERVWIIAHDRSVTGWSKKIFTNFGAVQVSELTEDKFNLKQKLPSRYFVKRLF